ncbi:uncharacterized protein LOC115633040 [Scaptodrosophila lebanonensis]|uniref:Uncharacterized protein LOC115633040 n=1 Tax=Drosophila lebanonensis TaxID=7225 RepID=A0A6J2UFR1_DROLE|nr:uncharacterized protein LOC115633040 [Scaptodrosophila lebanonensis]
MLTFTFLANVFLLLLSHEDAHVIHVILNDVVVLVTNDDWNCDKITCPLPTALCRVVVRPDNTNQGKAIRINMCLDEKNNTLIEKTFTEDRRLSLSGRLTMFTFRNGNSFSENNPLAKD